MFLTINSLNMIIKILKKWVPFEDYVFKTKLSVTEVYQRLSANIEPDKPLRKYSSTFMPSKEYEGTITENNFSINRVINYQNSFRPIISGTIENASGGTIVKVKMRLHTAVLIFMAYCCTFAGVFCTVILVNASDISAMNLGSLIPFVLFFGILGMTIGGFKVESTESRRFLQELLEAEVEAL